MEDGLTYRGAGVDIEAGERLVDRIKPLARATRIEGVLGGVGGFAGLFEVPPDMERPVLVSGTDGVGTKLRVAFLAGVHDTVGIDLVAMCVNDVLTVGARPLFFLDYFATGALDVDVAEAVIRGIAKGCELAGCALLGGETAEMPGSYPPGEYDLAGFAVGVVEKAKILDGSAVRAGDVLIALPSSGLHSNGYSLARKALFERGGLDVGGRVEELGATPIGEALLAPTRIYAREVAAALAASPIHAMCHVTGGGLPGNLPRVLAPGTGARIEAAPPPLPIFRAIARLGGVEEPEMRRAFNLGVGYVFVVPEAGADAVLAALPEAWALGRVVPSDASGEARVAYA
ncbi:MAG: phosphoribosylformylglycinamidine cyclo-ligase [Sandaracinaceae bacterium]|nr:phosphoribosylformylglycinamidine cyclo-ligase [Sandaracinaceae bacterium]